MNFAGKSVLLANNSGRFTRFIIAIWLCQSLDLRASITKSEESPKLIKNKAAKVPARPTPVKPLGGSKRGEKILRRILPAAMAAILCAAPLAAFSQPPVAVRSVTPAPKTRAES